MRRNSVDPHVALCWSEVNVVLMLGKRRSQWSIFKPTFVEVQRLVSAGTRPSANQRREWRFEQPYSESWTFGL